MYNALIYKLLLLTSWSFPLFLKTCILLLLCGSYAIFNFVESQPPSVQNAGVARELKSDDVTQLSLCSETIPTSVTVGWQIYFHREYCDINWFDCNYDDTFNIASSTYHLGGLEFYDAFQHRHGRFILSTHTYLAMCVHEYIN